VNYLENLEPQQPRKATPLDHLMTKAQLVRRKFKTGRPYKKDRNLSPLAAMSTAVDMYGQLLDLMVGEYNLPASDAMCALCVVSRATEAEDLQVLRIPIDHAKFPEYLERLAIIPKCLPLGILFAMRDREVKDMKKKFVAWVFPFLVGPKARAKMLEAKQHDVIGEFAMESEGDS
jgi:hypothetical protein